MEYKLNIKAEIFAAIVKQEWWYLFKDDTDLYIHVRKDNYINIYYRGGCVAKIQYIRSQFLAEIHHKYLGIPSNTEYVALDLGSLTTQKLADIKERINTEYINKKDDEHRAEKWIQADIILSNKAQYIDSEFAYNRDGEIGNLRIDIVKLEGATLQFIELKGIYNPELRSKGVEVNTPHIIEQISRYRKFITKYKQDIIDYYQTLCDVKYSLGIGAKATIETIDEEPLLWIEDTYIKRSSKRDDRVADIKNLLSNNNISYRICKSQSTEE